MLQSRALHSCPSWEQVCQHTTQGGESGVSPCPRTCLPARPHTTPCPWLPPQTTCRATYSSQTWLHPAGVMSKLTCKPRRSAHPSGMCPQNWERSVLKCQEEQLGTFSGRYPSALYPATQHPLLVSGGEAGYRKGTDLVVPCPVMELGRFVLSYLSREGPIISK